VGHNVKRIIPGHKCSVKMMKASHKMIAVSWLKDATHSLPNSERSHRPVHQSENLLQTTPWRRGTIFLYQCERIVR
jgi:hypothetical protein